MTPYQMNHSLMKSLRCVVDMKTKFYNFMFSDVIREESEFLSKNKVKFAYFAGSHSYGLADADSDFDISGYYIPDQKTVFGICPVKDQKQTFEFVYEGEKYTYNSEYVSETYKFSVTDHSGEKVLEGTLFDFRKYFTLIQENNPNILESLWVSYDLIITKDVIYEYLRSVRNQLFSQKVARTYLGYARSQIKRIATHRQWLDQVAPERPERASFGLPEMTNFPVSQRDAILSVGSFAELSDHNIEYMLSGLGAEFAFQASKMFNGSLVAKMKETYVKSTKSWLHTIHSLSNYFSEDVKAEALAELRYHAALQHYNDYLSWKKNRNDKRAELEKLVGFDCKHGCQVIRILKTGLEIIEDKCITLDRKIAGDAQFLIDLKRGRISYDAYLHVVTPLEKKMEELSKMSFKYSVNERIISKVHELFVESV